MQPHGDGEGGGNPVPRRDGGAGLSCIPPNCAGLTVTILPPCTCAHVHSPLLPLTAPVLIIERMTLNGDFADALYQAATRHVKKVIHT
jgi:hypothetical protein